MGRMWPRTHFTVAWIVWILCVDIAVPACEWDQVVTDFAVCSAAETDNGYGVEDLIYPTRSCSYYEDWVEYISFTTSRGRDFEIRTGDQIELHCEAESKLEGYTFTMWLCQRSSETLALCLCPQTASRSGGEKYPLEFVRSRDESRLSLNYTLTNATLSDQFYCLVQVSYGQHVHGFADINVDVEDNYGPEITNGPKNTTVLVGEELLVSCKAIGFPAVEYTWVKDGEQLSENNRTRSYVVVSTRQESKLYINATLPEDGGIYWCYAENSVGNARSEGAVVHVESRHPTHIPLVVPDLSTPVSIGVVAAVIALIAIVIVVVVYKKVIKKQWERIDEQRNATKPVAVTIDGGLDTKNFVLNVDGQGRDVTCNFMGDVNIGGANMADQIEADVEGNLGIPGDDEGIGMPYNDHMDEQEIANDDVIDEREMDVQAEEQDVMQDDIDEEILFDLLNDDVNDNMEGVHPLEMREEPEVESESDEGSDVE